MKVKFKSFFVYYKCVLDEDSVIGKYPEELVHMETEFLKNVHERALEIVTIFIWYLNQLCF